MENSLTVIIPAFNEEKSLKLFLPEVIQYCKENDFKLIIVNDGSTDQSKEIINSYAYKEDDFVLIHHKVNKGYGGAIKSAIEKTTTKYLITIDA
ncbi:MAG TPA: glycosyltransferase family 2 protein, partial [Bacteroidales bacterium]|nr:glycosyltransferase family 2 protein [Bacteroidales bacterium]